MQLIGDGLKHILSGDGNETFAALTFIGEQLIAAVKHKSNYELRVVDATSARIVSHQPLPQEIAFPLYDCILPMRGQTLVGMKGADVVIYRLSLNES